MQSADLPGEGLSVLVATEPDEGAERLMNACFFKLQNRNANMGAASPRILQVRISSEQYNWSRRTGLCRSG